MVHFFAQLIAQPQLELHNLLAPTLRTTCFKATLKIKEASAWGYREEHGLVVAEPKGAPWHAVA